MRLRQIGHLAWAGVLQLARTRVYLNILVAGVALVLAALAFDRMSAGEGGRVLLDVGTAFVALLVAVLAGVVSITGVTREIETKVASVVTARPLSRVDYVLGRFATAAALVVLSNLALGAVLAVVLVATDSAHAVLAFGAVLFASLEGLVIAAIAIFFGVGSSSTMSALFTGTIFILGRLTEELARLIEHDKFGGATALLKAVHALLPHLPAFDLTPLAHGASASALDLAQRAGYGLLYAGAFLAAAAFRFSRRDLL
ncbi:MAG: ABC transporter permease [Deltaproteobacteria bacterium]|nr:ABC transporter permease [Deltaproteobacteria bacterium]